MSGTVWPQVVLSDVNGVPYTAGNPVPITGSITATSAATATALQPTYVEGSSNPLSQDLAGDLRVVAKQLGTWIVSGTFFQATQPVSGTFWQATQPVSIASMPSTPVTGTFWQATQPVSIASMPSTPVTGTFFQATQPISAASLPLPAGAGTAANQATIITALATLPAGTNTIGHAIGDTSAASGGIANTIRLAASGASTNASIVRAAAPSRVYQLSGKNNAAYDVFLCLYDSSSNPPVPGTTTIRKKLVCPAGQAFVYDFALGLSFATGLGYAFTKLAADADTTAIAANDILQFNMDYT